MTVMRPEQQDIAKSIAQGCDAWRRGDDARGVESFQRAALLWLIEQEQQHEERPGDDRQYTQLSSRLGQALALLEAGDVAAALDVLEAITLPEPEVREGHSDV